MPAREKKVIPNATFFLLFPLAFMLDFSFGLIPVLGSFIGFLFAAIVNTQLSMAGYSSHQIARLAAIALSVGIEFVSLSVSPSNIIFVCIIYILNYRLKRRRRREQMQPVQREGQ